MSDQPEALRLADYLSAEEWPGGLDGRKLDKAATELRRLHKAEADFHMDYRMKCDAELKKLQAERDALKADAERYRRLRMATREQLNDLRDAIFWGAEYLDAAIDAASGRK